MQTGGRRKPLKLQAIEGRQKRAKDFEHGNPEYRELPAIAKPPGPLEGAALKEWERLYPLLSEAGAIREVDQSMLMLCCLAWGALMDTMREGKPVTPALLNSVRQAYAEFGLTPGSAGQVAKTEPPNKKKTNPIAALMQDVGK